MARIAAPSSEAHRQRREARQEVGGRPRADRHRRRRRRARRCRSDGSAACTGWPPGWPPTRAARASGCCEPSSWLRMPVPTSRSAPIRSISGMSTTRPTTNAGWRSSSTASRRARARIGLVGAGLASRPVAGWNAPAGLNVVASADRRAPHEQRDDPTDEEDDEQLHQASAPGRGRRHRGGARPAAGSRPRASARPGRRRRRLAEVAVPARVRRSSSAPRARLVAVGEPDPAVPGGGQRRRGAVEERPPAVEHDDSLAQRRDVLGLVGRQQHGLLAPSAARRSSRKRSRCSGSSPAVGSSRTSEVGVAEQRLGEGHPSPHAARQRADALAGSPSSRPTSASTRRTSSWRARRSVSSLRIAT